MATGVLIAESIPPPATVDAVPLTVHKLERVTPENISDEQRAAGIPPDWTLLHVEVADEDAPRLAEQLAAVLGDLGWYADLQTATETFVIYTGRVFRYPRGDAAGRAEAQEHGRAHGVPEPQLDWP
jgi:hypothetical protein